MVTKNNELFVVNLAKPRSVSCNSIAAGSLPRLRRHPQASLLKILLLAWQLILHTGPRKY